MQEEHKAELVLHCFSFTLNILRLCGTKLTLHTAIQKHFRTSNMASEKNATLNFSEQMHSE